MYLFISSVLRRTALFYAVLLGKEPVVRMLLEAGAKVNAHDKEGLSPLHVAAIEGIYTAHATSSQ